MGTVEASSKLAPYGGLEGLKGRTWDAVGTLGDGNIEAVTEETYGPLKALSEQAAERAMPGRELCVRPGLIVGPHDPTDRFT